MTTGTVLTQTAVPKSEMTQNVEMATNKVAKNVMTETVPTQTVVPMRVKTQNAETALSNLVKNVTMEIPQIQTNVPMSVKMPVVEMATNKETKNVTMVSKTPTLQQMLVAPIVRMHHVVMVLKITAKNVTTVILQTMTPVRMHAKWLRVKTV